MDVLDKIDIKTLKLLKYIDDKGGEIIGFREAAHELHVGYHTLKTSIKDLVYLGLIEKKSGPNNIMILKLTSKGRRVAGILRELLEALEA